MNINIRKTVPQDYKTVENIIREAFWNLYVPGCDEHYLAHVLRDHPDYISEMDFVAEVDNKIVGNIMYTKSFVIDEDNNKVETLTFGPFCVLPEYHYKGIGTALIEHSFKVAREKQAKAIIILGDPHNYCRHGFKNTIDFGISNSEGKYPYGQLVLELEKDFFKGKIWKFNYSQAYNLDEKKSADFDLQFPKKKKEHRPSQDVFFITVRATLG
jgi:predicted N-acetyltransferase YhbS